MREGERLGIAIPTFRRPAALAELLGALALQRLETRSSVAEVAVFDNDPDGSAAVLVRALAPSYPFRLTLHPVPTPGLCAVRNAVLSYAAERFDLLAMIDDDEVPAPGWLAALLHALETHAADAAVGPVPQLLPASAPRWLCAGNFFEIPTFADGATMADGYTGNCLIRTASIATFRLRFDERLNFCGGEDQLFFRQLVHLGGRIVFAAAAIAVERVPERRATLRYLCTRAFRGGNSVAFCDRCVYGTPAKLALRAAKGLGLIAIGTTAFLPRALLRGRTGIAHSLYAVARGAGMLGGLAGFMVTPYSRPVSLQEAH